MECFTLVTCVYSTGLCLRVCTLQAHSPIYCCVYHKLPVCIRVCVLCMYTPQAWIDFICENVNKLKIIYTVQCTIRKVQ